jgi:tetrahydromethanopterin S-methyltransferase subunit A
VEPPEIECRGCEVCFPAVALNVLADVTDPEALETAVCPAEKVSPGDGWPPLTGNFTVLGYQRPVAICTLNSEGLWTEVADARPNNTAIVGMLNTENLGIERLIHNLTANPNIRYLIVCGEDSQRKVGHLPGHSLIALSKNGIGERSKIIGAKGRRPVLRNIEPSMIDHFRRNVEITDMIGEISVGNILSTAALFAAKNPGPAETFQAKQSVSVECGYIPDRMASDPNGFFVVYPDQARGVISLEHFSNNGVLTTLIEGNTAAEVYHPAVEMKLLSRLDHACYLGRELAKAEQSLRTGKKYVQDAAPERSVMANTCGYSSGRN